MKNMSVNYAPAEENERASVCACVYFAHSAENVYAEKDECDKNAAE